MDPLAAPIHFHRGGKDDEDARERGIASIVGGQASCSAPAEGAEAPSAREAARGEGGERAGEGRMERAFFLAAAAPRGRG